MAGTDNNASFRLPLNAAVLVGRGASNHVVLDDPRISRQHARLAPEREGPVLYDLNSANGTIVNGVGVRRHKLKPDDIILFGRYAFRIECVPAEPDVSGAAAEEPTLLATESTAMMLLRRELAGFRADRQTVDLIQLEDAYQKLGIVYSFMQAISTTIDRRKLIRLIGEKIRGVYPAARSVGVYLRDRNTKSAAFKLADSGGAADWSDARELSADVSAALRANKQGMLVGEAPEGIRGGTDMFAPMMHWGDVFGVIHVEASERGRAFSLPDLELLNGMAAAAAVMFENTRIHEEALQRQRLEYDLELAAKIQKSFLPREVVSVEGLELVAEYRAAYAVGGDFYDVFWVGPGRLAVFIGDISGKGIAAALLMARISNELRVAALAHVEPARVLATMNASILKSQQPELFFTAVYFTVDAKTGSVVLANAGHPSPYWCRADGSVEPITAGAASAIGIFEDPRFETTSLQLAHGDSLVLYTDGVVEAADARGGLFGSDRLHDCLASGPSTHPNEIAERILKSVEQHATDVSVADDLTLFICHRCVGRPPSLQPRRRSGSVVAQNVRPLRQHG